MFLRLYETDVQLVPLTFVAWLVAGYAAGRMGFARTAGGLRRRARFTRAMLVLAGALTAMRVATWVTIWATSGWVFVADRILVSLPLAAVPAAYALAAGLPAVRRLTRRHDAAAGGAAGPAGAPARPDPALAAAAADPRAAVPAQAAAVAAGLASVLTLVNVPEPPYLTTLLLAWAVLAAAVAALVLRQHRRRALAALPVDHPRRAPWRRPVRALAGTAAVALVATAGLAWAAGSSRHPDRHNAASPHAVDHGGGVPAGALPAGAGAGAGVGAGGPAAPHANGHAGAGTGNGVAAVASAGGTDAEAAVTVDELREDDLTGQVRRYTLTAAVHGGGWAFNGTIPGPRLVAREGELVEVTLVNRDVAAGVTAHWHGVDVPNAEDGVAGVTQDAVLPGERHVYRFRADQVGTYWYHSHQQSSEQVRRGLFGALVVLPAAGTGDDVDITVVNHPDGYASHGLPESGRIRPGAKVRLRLINADSLPYRMTVTGTRFRVLAIDGGDLTGPTEIDDRLLIAGGGRYDIGFTMPRSAVRLSGRNPFVESGRLTLPADGPGGDRVAGGPGGGTFDPLRYGRPAPTPFGRGSDFDREFRLFLDNQVRFYDGRPAGTWTVNGRTYPDVPTLMVREGELIKVTMINRSVMDHPMHPHGHHMLVLSRNGRPATGSPWWTDTLNVAPGETYEVAMRADNPGLWMDHCHNLDHARNGMVLHLAYAGVGSPYESGRATRNQPE